VKNRHNTVTRASELADSIPDEKFCEMMALDESVSVFTLIRTDTTLDHSQKAEKVYYKEILIGIRKKTNAKDAPILSSISSSTQFDISHSTTGPQPRDPA
jgi:hypothetical protein